jgi:hypothetical protein
VYYARSGDVNILKMKYNFKQPYSKKHVEGFINDGIDNGKKLTSNPKMHGKKLIWVNTYNQRVYLFTWDKADKKWVISSRYPKGLPCNTGKELTPYGIFHVTSKWDVKESTGTRWWCIFNSVGIHEKLGDALGHPASGGCVRIPDADARWFYFNVGKMTTVLVY